MRAYWCGRCGRFRESLVDGLKCAECAERDRMRGERKARDMRFESLMSMDADHLVEEGERRTREARMLALEERERAAKSPARGLETAMR